MKQFKINKNYTNRSEESLDKYLVEINRIPMITPDQEVELAQIIRKGGKKGEEAKNRIVFLYLYLYFYIFSSAACRNRTNNFYTELTRFLLAASCLLCCVPFHLFQSLTILMRCWG